MADTEEGHSDETRWVSYGELAHIQGISKVWRDSTDGRSCCLTRKCSRAT